MVNRCSALILFISEWEFGAMPSRHDNVPSVAHYRQNCEQAMPSWFFRRMLPVTIFIFCEHLNQLNTNAEFSNEEAGERFTEIIVSDARRVSRYRLTEAIGAQNALNAGIDYASELGCTAHANIDNLFNRL